VLHKEIPFLRIGLPLCAGIITGLYFNPDNLFLVLSAIFIISGLIISLFFNRFKENLIFGLFLTAGMFICGLLLYRNEKNSLSVLKPERTMFCGILSDYPVEKTNSYMLTVKLKSRISTNGYEAVKGSILLYNKKDTSVTSYLPGDILLISCTPVSIRNRGNPNEFDYKFYMENNGTKYYAYTTSDDILSHISPNNRKLIHKALIIREKIIWMYKESGVTDDRLALVSAITLGQKNKLDPEQKQIFIKAGVMHIMAVSGLHTVILSLFIFKLLFFLKGRFNILRILITILILWSFAFVTGLTPSVLRATLMFTFLHAGNIINRRINGINSVLASAFILILIRPSVIFDAGFLLSYSAVIFIICYYQDLYNKFHFKNWLTDKIWQSAVVTIVAQAGTLPLTIMLFNRFPAYFILTNIIIVPLSSLLVVLGCLIPLIYPIHFISKPVALILDRLTGLTEFLTAKASSLPGSNIENIGMLPPECFLLGITIFLFCFYIIKNKPISVFYPAFSLLLFVIAGTITGISTKSSNQLIVYNIPGSTTIGIKTGKVLNIYSDTLSARPEVLRHCATLGLILRTNTLKSNILYIRAGDKKILISNYLNQNVLQNAVPDIMILTGLRPLVDIKESTGRQGGTIIISPESSSGFRINPQLDLSSTDSIHFVKKSGAFTCRL
jgi:competence protein ComEC